MLEELVCLRSLNHPFVRNNRYNSPAKFALAIETSPADQFQFVLLGPAHHRAPSAFTLPRMPKRRDLFLMGTMMIAMIAHSLADFGKAENDSEIALSTSRILFPTEGESSPFDNNIIPEDLQAELSDESQLHRRLLNRILLEIRRCEEEKRRLDWEKRAPMSFHSTRGKKGLLGELHVLVKDDTTGLQKGKDVKEWISGPNGYFLITSSDYAKKTVPFYAGYGKRLGDKRFRKGYTGLRGKRVDFSDNHDSQ